jgi:oligopeptide/dipeptide ABC transporter ATP-binding protein
MLLSVRDLTVRFRTHDGTVHAVNGVSFDLEEGETLGLVGESGSGKSVTNLAVMRLLPQPAGHIERGTVLFEELDLTNAPEASMRDLRGREIAMIFQDPMTSLNPVLTIEEQMVETIQAHKRVTAADARVRAIQLLGMVGIAEPASRLRNYPHQFSGGMRQRVMIAIALALEPKLLIADEPTTALDVTIQAQVLDLMRSLRADTGAAIILITHDLGVIAELADDVAVMYAGRVVERASVERLFSEPQHPYTIGLLGSIPKLHLRQSRLAAIEGQVPTPMTVLAGCRFAARCPFADSQCEAAAPPLTEVQADHFAACWKAPLPWKEAA